MSNAQSGESVEVFDYLMVPAEEEWDGAALCPYYARYYELEGFDPAAICNQGCQDEPQCVTCEPADGWPSRQQSGRDPR